MWRYLLSIYCSILELSLIRKSFCFVLVFLFGFFFFFKPDPNWLRVYLFPNYSRTIFFYVANTCCSQHCPLPHPNPKESWILKPVLTLEATCTYPYLLSRLRIVFHPFKVHLFICFVVYCSNFTGGALKIQ